MERVITPEMMDAPDIGRDELDESLEYIRLVNRRLGGVSSLLRHLRAWSRNWPTDRPVTLLDIATGSADIPLAARRWASDRGFDLRVTAIDVHPLTVELAREHVGDTDGIEIVQADATSLTDRYADRSFDYVHVGLFLHHLKEIRILTVLRIMDRLAARGIVWNDLVRTRIGLAAIHLLTVGKPEIVRHDARVSVRAGFTRDEAVSLARRVGIDYARYRQNPLTHRFTIAGERPGAWPTHPN